MTCIFLHQINTSQCKGIQKNVSKFECNVMQYTWSQFNATESKEGFVILCSEFLCAYGAIKVHLSQEAWGSVLYTVHVWVINIPSCSFLCSKCMWQKHSTKRNTPSPKTPTVHLLSEPIVLKLEDLRLELRKLVPQYQNISCDTDLATCYKSCGVFCYIHRNSAYCRNMCSFSFSFLNNA